MGMLLALTLGVVSAFGTAADAPQTLYVAPTGSDASDCLTPATACASFNRGWRMASPGDEVELAGGTYPGPQHFSHDASKTSPVDVIVRPAPGAKVVVDCDWPDNCLATEGADHLTVRGVATSMLPPAAGVEENVGKVFVGQAGVAMDRGSVDVTYEDIDAGHIWISSDFANVIGGDFGPTVDEVSKISETVGPDLLIDGATFHDHLHNASHMECIALYGAQGVTIRRSRFDTCSTYAIFSTPESVQAFRDVTIESNVFSNSGDVDMSEHVKIGSHGGSCTNFLIRNNTFVDQGIVSDCGIGPTKGTATNIRWIGNIFSDWNPGKTCDTGGHVFDYNVIETGFGCGPHDRAVGKGNAGYVNRAALDFRLAPGSPAIDAGSPDDFAPKDFAGQLRPLEGAPDAGAYEFDWRGVDVSKPTIDIRSPVDGALLRRGAALIADFSCGDPGSSGVVSCEATPVDTTQDGERRFTVTARDRAGNEASETVTYIVDGVAPSITIESPREGAYRVGADVQPRFSCADVGGSGLASCAAATPVDTVHDGEHEFTVTARDGAGNEASSTVRYLVDGTEPQIDVRVPADGATYSVGDSVAPDFGCSDGQSGVASCAGTVAKGAALDLSQPGEQTFTVSATDRVGHTAASVVSYEVVEPPRAALVRRFGPSRWRRDAGGPRATLAFTAPTMAQLSGPDGLALTINCRRRCRAAARVTFAGNGATVVRRDRAIALSAAERTLHLRLPARLRGAEGLRLSLSVSVADRRGRHARLKVPAFSVET